VAANPLGGASLIFSLNVVDDGSRIAKRFEVFQGMAVIVPGVAAFNLLDERSERVE
jgi:hypothetical protein